MKIKIAIIAAALLPSYVMAQMSSYDPSSGQRFDQYGRPTPSIEEMCREGQMAGGPITLQCGQYGYRFNRKGEKMVYYNFEKWDYSLLSLLPVTTANRLDTDAAYRAAYIKSHHIKRYVKPVESDSDVIVFFKDGTHLTRGELRARCAETPSDPLCR
jgi:hypothetical protein